MACNPGDPCYNAYYHPNENCGSVPCETTADHVIYNGPTYLTQEYALEKT